MHSGGGFSGKGFKFDETEAMIVNEKKKFQKAALGLFIIFYVIIFYLYYWFDYDVLSGGTSRHVIYSG